MIGGEQTHDDSGRAETALRSVAIDHRPLQRMQLAALGEALDRDEFRSVELTQEQYTGVHRLIGEGACLKPRQNDSASAAIPLRAALLRPLGSHFLAKPIENGRAGRKAVEDNLAAPEKEAQGIANAGRSCRKRHHSFSIPTP